MTDALAVELSRVSGLATEAKAAQEAHQDICSERYDNINKSIGELKARQDKHGVEVSGSFTRLHGRIDTIIKLMLVAVASLCLFLLGALGTIAFYLITSAMPAAG